MAKSDAKKAADEAAAEPKPDERDERIAALEAELADAKKAADEAASSARRTKAALDDAQAEIALMVEEGAKRAEPTKTRVVRVKARNPKLSGFNFYGVTLGPEFVELDVSHLSEESFASLLGDPIADVES
jgi:hypothetical protein